MILQWVHIYSSLEEVPKYDNHLLLQLVHMYSYLEEVSKYGIHLLLHAVQKQIRAIFVAATEAI